MTTRDFLPKQAPAISRRNINSLQGEAIGVHPSVDPVTLTLVATVATGVVGIVAIAIVLGLALILDNN